MMKIRKISLVVASAVLMSASNVYAENYLFPTDIVDKGRIDIDAGVSRQTYSQTSHFSGGGFSANWDERRDRISEHIGARYGIAEDWHVEVRLPYDSRERLDIRNRPGGNLTVPESTQNFDGAGNMEFGIKHRLIGNSESSFNLSGRLLLGANTAGDSKTTLTADAIAGWRLDDSLQTYAGYQGFFVDQDQQPDRHSMVLGLHKRLHERLTIVPQASFSYYEAAHRGSLPTAGHIKQYAVGISAHWQLCQNTYLLPGFTYGQISSYNYGPGLFDSYYDKSTDAKVYSLSFYHLF
jgi:hypothetical protein